MKQAGCLDGKALDPAGGGMDALEECAERVALLQVDDQLAVKDEGFGGHGRRSGSDLWEIAHEVATALRLHTNSSAIAAQQAAKSVPFRLVLPLRPAGISVTDSASIGSMSSTPLRSSRGPPS